MLYLRDEAVSWSWFLASKIVTSKNRFIKFLLLPQIAMIFHYSLCLLTGNDLSARVYMKGRVKIYHAIGIIVGSGVIFGTGVILRAHVTLGAKSLKRHSAPSIGNDVVFGVGAMVFGDTNIPNEMIVRAGQIYT